MPGRPKKQIATASELETATERLSELALNRAPRWIRDKYETLGFVPDDDADARLIAWVEFLDLLQRTHDAAMTLHDVYRLGLRTMPNDDAELGVELAGDKGDAATAPA